MIQIREATPADIPEIARVHARADWETYSTLFGAAAYALDVVECERRWRRALRDGGVLLVAVEGGVIVGLGHAYANRIGALYLLASHQRRGIGRAMLERLLQALCERGVTEAQFDVVAVNAGAISFYRAQGARPVGRLINRDPRGDTEDLVFAIATGPALSDGGG